MSFNTNSQGFTEIRQILIIFCFGQNHRRISHICPADSNEIIDNVKTTVFCAKFKITRIYR